LNPAEAQLDGHSIIEGSELGSSDKSAWARKS
jgi:hypothetical protein